MEHYGKYVFQYLYGAVKRHTVIRMADNLPHFNTYIVQLKVSTKEKNT
ncbi:hypothetical protein HMPREF9713_00445 [Myroides odoratimimus CCUG 12700]|nr:hypothetical protein HMPREF9713_00445 [Myroides odoratimimus CCUG 12700]